jgi:hypothetical protein
MVDERRSHGKRRIRLELLNGMHIAALATVADETRTMLHNGLAHGSHQWAVGHRGTADRVVPHSRFSANACPGSAGVEKLHSNERGSDGQQPLHCCPSLVPVERQLMAELV